MIQTTIDQDRIEKRSTFIILEKIEKMLILLRYSFTVQFFLVKEFLIKFNIFSIFSKMMKIDFFRFCLHEMQFVSCFYVFQPHSAYCTPLAVSIFKTPEHAKTLIFTVFLLCSPRDEFLRGVLTRSYFSKSSHHAEHFHILSFLHISLSFEAIVL